MRAVPRRRHGNVQGTVAPAPAARRPVAARSGRGGERQDPGAACTPPFRNGIRGDLGARLGKDRRINMNLLGNLCQVEHHPDGDSRQTRKCPSNHHHQALGRQRRPQNSGYITMSRTLDIMNCRHPDAYSGASRSLIPVESDHRFRSQADHFSAVTGIVRFVQHRHRPRCAGAGAVRVRVSRGARPRVHAPLRGAVCVRGHGAHLQRPAVPEGHPHVPAPVPLRLRGGGLCRVAGVTQGAALPGDGLGLSFGAVRRALGAVAPRAVAGDEPGRGAHRVRVVQLRPRPGALGALCGEELLYTTGYGMFTQFRIERIVTFQPSACQ